MMTRIGAKTRLENKIIEAPKKEKVTQEIEFSEDDVTPVEPVVLQENKFALRSKDIHLIENVAEMLGVDYEKALNVVLHDALDIFHKVFPMINNQYRRKDN